MAMHFVYLIPLFLAGAWALADEVPFRVPPFPGLAGKTHPFLAATPRELTGLRATWKAGGDRAEALKLWVSNTEVAMKSPIAFPPRGGAHNQMYQCRPCQMGLKLTAAGEHQCPKCKTIYTGEPYDDVEFNRLHGLLERRLLLSAWAFAFTGEAHFAEDAKAILLGYADRYLVYPFHDANQKQSASGGRIHSQTLDEAFVAYLQFAPAFDLIAPTLTEAEKSHVLEDFFKPMGQHLDERKAKKSNWQSFHNAGLFYLGACLGNTEWMQKALEDPENGFLFQMENSVSEEGMWYEGSWAYHFYTLMGLTGLAEGARRIGWNFWDHPKFRRMFLLPASYTMADGTMPRFGDDVRSSTLGAMNLMSAAYQATGDARIAAILPDKLDFWALLVGRTNTPSNNPGAAPLRSEVFPESGHIIFRASGPAAMTGALVFGPYGGFHGHFDKLGFVLFGNQKELVVDPGRAKSQAYSLPIHKDWYKATLGHNTVLVDETNQVGTNGFLVAFASENGTTLSWCQAPDANPHTDHHRVFILTPRYALVWDRLAARDHKTHTYDFLLHPAGRGFSRTESFDPCTPKAFAGLEYVRDIRAIPPDCQQLAVEDVSNTTKIYFDSDTRGPSWLGHGPFASVDDRVPMLLLRRSGTQGRFAVALEPVAEGGKPWVKSIRFVSDLEVQITHEQGSDKLVWDEKGLGFTRPGYKEMLALKP